MSFDIFLPFPMDYVFHLDSLNVKFAHFCIGNFKAFSGSVKSVLLSWFEYLIEIWRACFAKLVAGIFSQCHSWSSCQVVSQYWGHEFEPSLFRVWLCFEIICPSYWSWCSQWWNSILILIKDCEAQYWAHNNFETIPINGGEVVNTVPRMFFQHFTFETNSCILMHCFLLI